MTDSDWLSICYFWQDKGDVTRWAGWETHKDEIGTKYPELVFAISQKKIFDDIIDAIVEKIEREQG